MILVLTVFSYFVKVGSGSEYIVPIGLGSDSDRSKNKTKSSVSIAISLDGNSEHNAHARKKCVFSEEEKIRIASAIDLSKCLKQIK